MPARVKAEGGFHYISIMLGVAPVCNGCKARKTGGGEMQGVRLITLFHSLLTRVPVCQVTSVRRSKRTA